MTTISLRCALSLVQPPWWSEYDEPILRVLADAGVALTPGVILFNLEYFEIASPHASTVKRRLSRLQEHEYVEKVGDGGYYVIAEKGQTYLEGQLDTDELDPGAE